MIVLCILTTTTEEGILVHLALFVDVEPINFQEAIDIRVSKKAMKEELDTIEGNQTWEHMESPKHKKTIYVKWISFLRS